MKLLLATTSYPLDSHSHSGIFVGRLTAALRRYADVTVVCPADDKKRIPAKNLILIRYAPTSWRTLCHKPGGIPAGVRKSPLSILMLSILCFLFFFYIIKECKNKDVIFANWSLIGLIAGIAGRIRGIPVVTAIRGSDIHFGRNFIGRQILIGSCKVSKRLVCVGQDLASRLLALVPQHATKTRVILNGIARANYRPGKRYTNRLRCIFIGNLTQNKSVHTIIKAVQCTRIPSITLTIVGSGPEYDNLARLADQIKESNQVSFMGLTPPDEINGLLASHDVLILASRREGRPNIIIEAMASGCVVVATNISGVNEIIRDHINGLLFDMDDYHQLANHLTTLYADDAIFAKLQHGARTTIIEELPDWETCALSYIDLFGELTDSVR